MKMLALAIVAAAALFILRGAANASATAPTGSTGTASARATALSYLNTNDNAAALARMLADPSDKEWFNVMDEFGHPTGHIDLQTLAQATTAADAVAVKTTGDAANRATKISELNRLSAQLLRDHPELAPYERASLAPLPLSATDSQIQAYQANYQNTYPSPDANSLGFLSTGLNAIGASVGLPGLGNLVEKTAKIHVE